MMNYTGSTNQSVFLKKQTNKKYLYFSDSVVKILTLKVFVLFFPLLLTPLSVDVILGFRQIKLKIQKAV